MAQSLRGGGVLASDEAARIAAGRFIPSDRVVVMAGMEEFMAGDSCVRLVTGTRSNSSRFWMPTKHIYHWSMLIPGATPIWNGGEIPDYNVTDVLRHADAPYWDWRR